MKISFLDLRFLFLVVGRGGGLNLLMVLALGGRRKGKGIEGEREKRD